MNQAPRSSGYEFTSTQNGAIGLLAFFIKAWAVFSVIGGGLLLFGGFAAAALVQGPQATTLGVALVVLGMPLMSSSRSYWAAAKAFQAVTDTEGDDIQLLLVSFRKFTRAVGIEALLGLFIIVIATCATTYIGALDTSSAVRASSIGAPAEGG